MRLAVWNIPPCRLLFGEDRPDDEDDVQVFYHDPDSCRALLRAGEVDVALVAINDVLRNVDEYAIIPDAVFASGPRFPHAAMRLNAPMDEIRSVDVLKTHRQAGELAEIILREQYRLDVEVRYRDNRSFNGDAPDAYVTFGELSEEAPEGRRRLDIGQEWFEMTGRPLVWGVFTVLPGRPDGGFGEQLQAMLPRTQADPERSKELSDLRLRFDPDVLEGLDEMAHYLFYFGKVDDIPAPRFLGKPESSGPRQ